MNDYINLNFPLPPFSLFSFFPFSPLLYSLLLQRTFFSHRAYLEPSSVVKTKFIFRTFKTAIGQSYTFLFSSHSWENPINVIDRVRNPNTYFLLLLFAILGLLVGTKILIFFFEIIGIKDFFHIFFRNEITCEGNPDYLEALSSKTLVTRISTGKYVCTCVRMSIYYLFLFFLFFLFFIFFSFLLFHLLLF